MILQCDKCGAKFNLADEKISEKGTSVRCSKCKHVFKATRSTTTPVAQAPKETPTPAAPAGNSFEFVYADNGSDGMAEDVFGTPNSVLGEGNADAVEEVFGDSQRGETSQPAVVDPFLSEAIDKALHDDARKGEGSMIEEWEESQPKAPVSLPKPIALKTIKIETKPKVTQYSGKVRRVHAISPTLVRSLGAALFLASVVMGLSVRGVRPWKAGERQSVFSPYLLQQGNYRLFDLHQRRAQISEQQSLTLISGKIINLAPQALAAPKLRLIWQDKAGATLKLDEVKCCGRINLDQVRNGRLNATSSANAIEMSEAPLAADEVREFMIPYQGEGQPNGIQIQINPQ